MAHWEITITSNFSAIRNASDLLMEYCTQCHISPELSGQLELMMVEALNNVIEHAYQGKDGSEARVEIIDEPQQILINITDFGVSAPYELYSGNKSLPDEYFLPEGGWGLPLIQALADNISYSSTKNSNLLTLTKSKN